MALETQSLKLAQQLGRSYRAMLAAFEQQVGHCLPRWRILFRLYEQPDLAQRELAQALDMDPGALTRQLKTLHGQGWVERRTCDSDNRQTLVRLSQTGLQQVEQALPGREVFFRQLFDGWSEDSLRQFEQQLQRLEQQARNLAGSVE